MATTFTYVPDRGLSKNTKPRVITYQFGDGYSQRITDGINARNNSWNLNFNGRGVTEAEALIAFFEATNGTSYFFWTPPGESTQVKVIASDWNKAYDSHISRNVSVTFTQVYDL